MRKIQFKKYVVYGIWYVVGVAFFVFPSTTFAATNLAPNFAFGQLDSLGSLINYLVPVAFSIAGIMVAFYFFTACFEYINSHGDKNAVAAARQKIEHSIIGLILLIGAFMAVRYLPFALGLGAGLSIIK